VYIDAKAEKLAVHPSSTLQTQDQEEASTESVVAGQRLTADEVREFTEAYDERKQLMAELKALDIKAQKGKIPRRQYKVQRRAIEIQLENIKRSTRKLKNILRSSSGTNANLMKQIDSSEAELVEVEKVIRDLEIRQSKGEISLEVYKRNLADYQRRKDKAEATINGILLRLREKIR
jgi:chromosome segregation ATPase